MTTPERLECYMRGAAGMGRETIEIPPFVAFLDPFDPLSYFNYAHPLRPDVGNSALLHEDLAGALASLRAVFRERQRTPRFEFVEEYAPDLAEALAAAGFVQEGRYPLLVCDPKSYRPARKVPGLEIQQLGLDSPIGDLMEFVAVGWRGFSHRVGERVTEEDGEDLRDDIRRGGMAFLARLNGKSVSVSSFTAPLEGLAELTGIATLPEHRRKGIATAMTSAAVQAAFGCGVDTAFLTAGDEQAGRVYQRVGFRPHAWMLAYSDRPL